MLRPDDLNHTDDFDRPRSFAFLLRRAAFRIQSFHATETGRALPLPAIQCATTDRKSVECRLFPMLLPERQYLGSMFCLFCDHTEEPYGIVSDLPKAPHSISNSVDLHTSVGSEECNMYLSLDIQGDWLASHRRPSSLNLA